MKKDIFKTILQDYENEGVRIYAEELLEKLPEYIYSIPSSTTGKYHSKQQCEDHGQVIHVYMVCKFCNYLLGLDYNKNKFSDSVIRDYMRIACLFHDCLKCGTQEEYNSNQYSRFEHPILSANFIRNTVVDHDISESDKELIASLIESHSGQWTTSNRSPIILPSPSDDMHMFIHECDYLGSRADLSIDIPNEMKEAFGIEIKKPTPPDINLY